MTEGECDVIDLSFSLSLQVSLGTVTNVEEAVRWLSYTYLYICMRANPLAYGINHKAYQVHTHACAYTHMCTHSRVHT